MHEYQQLNPIWGKLYIFEIHTGIIIPYNNINKGNKFPC